MTPRFPKRFIAFFAAFTLLGCDAAPPPDVYGFITQVREVAIEDAESSGGSGGMGNLGSGGSGAGELIVLGAILVIIGTVAIMDALSDHDLHARKAVMYDVRLPSGEILNLLQDEKESRPVLEPGQWVMLHYGKGNPANKHCFKPMPADPQGRAVLQLRVCDFVKSKVPTAAY